MTSTSPAPEAPLEVPLIVARGDSAQQGATIGTATGDKMRAAIDIYAKRFRDEVGLDDTAQERLGDEYARIVADFSPGTAQLLDAMAEAAGVTRQQVHLLNARSEVLYGTSAPSEADGACTTGAVLGSHTSDERTYLLQNWDWRYNLRDQIYLLATEDPDGHQILTLAEAGMTAKAGINSAGVAVGLNLLASDRNKRIPGVPVHVLLREVLQQRRLSTAISVALQADREGSANLVLASHEGDAIDLELVSDDFAHHLPVHGIVTHSNHFQTRRGWRDLYVDKAAFTLLRDYRFRRLLESHGSDIGVAAMRTALSDHSSFPDSICRHVDEAVEPEMQVSTLCSMIIDTAARSIHFAPLNPCSGDFREYRLADLFTLTNA
jgi:isopenicillin-N N-acyltransferase like protein